MPFIEALGQFSYRVGKEIVNSHNFLLSLHMFLLKDVASMFILLLKSISYWRDFVKFVCQGLETFAWCMSVLFQF